MDIEPGVLYGLPNNINKKKEFLTDSISIFSIRDGYILNKDGSIAIGFKLTLPEEESMDADGFTSLINGFSAACKRLPIGTVIQKMDIYYQEEFNIPIASELPFFHRKTLEAHNKKKILKHKSLLFLRFLNKENNPLNTSSTLGSVFFTPSIEEILKNKESIESACGEFMHSMPSGLEMEMMNDEEHKKIMYQYINLNFTREPIGFESGLTALEDSIVSNFHTKIVRMKGQAQDVFDSSNNNLGIEGVTSPFTWPITHFANFPHIVCQQVEIISDEQFRKAKSRELAFVAQLTFGARGRELAEYIQESFMDLEKELNEKNTKIVKLNYHVIVWDIYREKLQVNIDYIKSSFGKLGILAEEEKEDTLTTFLTNIPGGTGFLEGVPMPLETAVAYLNFVTPKQGDQAGILLSNRHGQPIYYDPFKYTLDNQHAFVFGPSGSGKSFFNGKMIKDRYYAGHTVIVIDSGGTYRMLFEALGGTYIDYRPERPLQFNPFLFKKNGARYIPNPEKISFLINFIAKIWKGDLHKNPLSEIEYAIFSKFLSKYYEALSDKDVPTLIGFCTWLKNYTVEEKIANDLFNVTEFLLILEPFTEGIYKEHFNALEIVHPEDTKLLCFELEAIKSDSKLYPLVVKVLFDYVLQLVASQGEEKKFIDIEEGWTMLDDSSQDYIESFFRKGRKTNTSIRIITQNVDEIKNSSIAGAMKNNASTFMLLYNDKESVRSDIADFLGMTSFDLEKYASLRRRDSYIDGYREVFIKEMDTSSVWRVETSLFEHGILTSRPDERNAIAKLKKATGDIEIAVIDWVESVLKKYK